MTSSNTKEITSELSALINGTHRTWAQISALIFDVKHSGYWRKDADSFSQWLETFGKKIGLGKATLWRYYSAGNKYNNLRISAKIRKLEYPPLEELQDFVSPENLEILDKLTRVMDVEEAYIMMDEILEGTIRRSDLRNKWNAFKPALEGQTSRGKSRSPKIDKTNEEQVRSLLEGEVLEALRNAGSSWLDLNKAVYYRFAPNVMPDIKSPGHLGLRADAPEITPSVIVAVKEKNTSPMLIHAIEIASQLSPSLIEKLEGLWWYSNFSWLALHQDSPDIDLSQVPEGVGVIGVANNGKTEKLVEAAGSYSTPFLDRTLKGLLLKGTGA